jgi:transposase-like protein
MSKSAKKQGESQGWMQAMGQLLLPLAQLVRGDVKDLVTWLGIQAIAAMLEQERTRLCGPRYQHEGARRAGRGGHADSSVALGGRKVKMRRPRVVDADGAEIPLSTWQVLSKDDPLTARMYEQMMVGVATRKYARSLEPLPEQLEESGTSKSSVSRRFIEATAEKLDAWMRRPLGEFDVVAVFIDGIHLGEHVVLVALGVDSLGAKHVLGLWEGATENTEACRALLADLVERGVKPDRTRLFVIDGSKALRGAIRDAFGRRALVQRCQVHKVSNVLGHLPKKMHASVRHALRQAYQATKIETAKRLLNALAKRLESDHPSAASSLREGLDETLTVMGLKLPRSLERSFSTTNPIECLNSRIRQVAGRVKRWQGGNMVLRWAAAAVNEAARGFRRLKGHIEMPKLIAALRTHDDALKGVKKTLDSEVEAA